MLGGVLLAQKKYAEAEPLLVQGCEGLKQQEAKIPLRSLGILREALQWLVQLYRDWGKQAEADKWQKDLDTQKKKAGVNNQESDQKSMPD